MEEMKVQPEEQELDLLEMFCVLWHRAWLLLLSLVVGAALAGAVTFLMGAVTNFLDAPDVPDTPEVTDTPNNPDIPDTPYIPLYQANSTIYAFSANTDVEIFLMELELSNSLAADLRILGTTHEVVESALDACDIERSYEEVVGSIVVINPTPHMLQIFVTDEDPQLAAQLCNAVADQLKQKVAEVMGIDVPSTASSATVPTKPINPPAEPAEPTEPAEPANPDEPVNPIPEDLKRNCILGGLIFFVLAAGAVLADYFLRDSFKEKMAEVRSKQRGHKSAA